ncbi:peptidase C26 [Pseudoroseomonas deserti]|uniref:Peptidase C26 n=2 Tax=Teichococcus deserti TaxID=1817963 RepID=A0A1V2H945_9PROT|nr:peptidase C26 [Pseudoroseomonas deserti]
MSPSRYAAALVGGAGAVPVQLPPTGRYVAVDDYLDRLDGLLVPGAPSHVDAALYGAPPLGAEFLLDPARDATVMPLIRAAIARGMPVLAICRGLQEMNVAFGGSLHAALHEVPGRMDHRTDGQSPAERNRLSHPVEMQGLLRAVVGRPRMLVNSSHLQGVDRVAEGLAIEALAPDGTVEALRPSSATGFQLAVQWHPEWRFDQDAPSTALFRAFGAACTGIAP